MELSEYIWMKFDRISWLIHRIWCKIVGCDLHYWADNEYVSGYDCRRCDSGRDTTGNEAPFDVVWKSESVCGRISFWWEQLIEGVRE